jgi:type I restriction enzyme S subunit
MSVDFAVLVSDNLELWTSAIERKSRSGRGGGKKVRLYGIERLRGLILDLAVRGKLVPQNAGDEPAASLLAQIDAGRGKLVDAGFVRGAKAGVNRAAVENPFPVPRSWLWVRLDRLGAIVGGGTPSANDPSNFAEPGEGIPWLTPADLSRFEEKTIGRGQRDLTKKGAATSSARVMPAGTVLFTSRAPIGYVAIAANPLATNQGFKSIVPFVDGLSSFIALALKAFAEEIDANASGTTFKEVSGKIVEAIPFPLPPLAEQRRIVAKVDELMALCDVLENLSTASLEAHQTLVESLLATLVNATDPADLVRQWVRFEAHFDSLFTTEHSIDALRQTVLELAVRGKLVEQDGEDRPAAALLTDTGGSQSRRRSGAQSQNPALAEEKRPYEIPNGWAWARFDQIAKIRAELVQSLDHPDAFQIAPDIIEKGTGKLLAVRTVEEAGVRGPNSRFYAGQIIYSKIRPSLSKAVIAEFDGLCSADMYPLDTHIDPSFLLRTILSEPFLRQVRAAENRIKMPKLNKESLGSFIIALPPLAEQYRIVAKFDELMALCDALKARLANAGEIRRHLADAVVERAAA